MSRVRRAAGRLVLVLLSVTLLAGVMPPASADRAVIRDARNDVLMEDGRGQASYVGFGDPDILKTRVEHRRHRVVFRVELDRLRQRDPHAILAMFGVNGRRFRLVAALDTEGIRPVEVVINEEFEAVDCPRLQARFQYAREVLKVRIPRSCMGDPRWVRLHEVLALRVTDTGRTYLDSGLARGFSSIPDASRRLFRG